MTKRTCVDCRHQGAAETDFHCSGVDKFGKNIYRRSCKSCYIKKVRLWQEENDSPIRRKNKNAMTEAWRQRMRDDGKMEAYIRQNHWKVKYRLTVERYGELLLSQGGVCAVCKKLPEGPKLLAVDHDHSCCPTLKTCGKCIRGLICQHCNHILGHAFDDLKILVAAVAYLQSWQNKEAVA